MKEYFVKEKICWQSIYYYFNKWSKDGSFRKAWIGLSLLNKRKLEMSNVQLDGSHTPSRMGGEKLGYQARKKAKTTNSIF
ncbi:IS5/IS1182 family transposase, partial [Elizabethkingia argentiflava]|nr:IS5/IS1182 family transposase [Elizabethkingia argenteiflava]